MTSTEPPELPADTAEDGPVETYPGAPDSLIEIWKQRRRRLKLSSRDVFPPTDLELRPLLDARIPQVIPALEGHQTLHAKKLHLARTELAGLPELAAVNAILIAHLRKQRYPAHTPALFRRIWAEAGAELIPQLPGRWLISSAITFGEFGETEAERRVGLSINLLFSLMKLYEFERFHSGLPAETAFPNRNIRNRRLPLDMPHFHIAAGGLDINLLVPIWLEAQKVPVVGPIACHLLQQLNEDPSNLFRRIGLMRAGKHLARIGRTVSPSATGAEGEA
ncbi:MAG: hypothetical protein EON48_05070 [Acetobacteraceae bacterium]|nr:MAG: hypothetical protein EON48_05070 [Acetobacteraceae bacterium]